MSDSLRISPNPQPLAGIPAATPPAKPAEADAGKTAANALSKADSAAVGSHPRGQAPALQSLMETDPPAAATSKEVKSTPNPWRVRSINFDYGLMFDVRYSKSDIHIRRPEHGTDAVLRDVPAYDRTSAHYLYSMPNGHPQPDEPQSDFGFAVQFENNWGIELNLKHNKYVVTTGDDPDQQVHVTGTINGEHVDGMHSLKDIMPEYQITNGLNQISVMATRAFELPSPGQHRFTYNLKAGPSFYMPYTKSTFKNPDGSLERATGPYHLSGFGAIVEHSLRYELPISRRSAISTELLHGMSYAHIPKSTIPGGHATQSLFANQLGLTLGYTFSLDPRPKR